jgi:hypothetical protein
LCKVDIMQPLKMLQLPEEEGGHEEYDKLFF